MSRQTIVFGMIFVLIALAGCGPSTAPPQPDDGGDEPAEDADIQDDGNGTQEHVIATGWTTAVEPKPLSEQVKKGLAWLVEHQHKNGGWAQGEESKHMGRSMDTLKEKPNVGDTCTATLALLRSGSTPGEGPYATNIARALDFICSEVEKADKESLSITSVRGTRLQSKLGQHIDTFMTSMVLAEARGKMPNEESNKRVSAALDNVLDKIERHQQADGSWKQQGWASALAESMAAKGLNRARQAGAKVDETVLDKTAKRAQDQFDKKTGGVAGGGSAGVELYARGANQGILQDAANSNAMRKNELREIAKNGDTDEERKKAKNELEKIKENEVTLEEATKASVKRMSDKKFISGFGSNGGEEFLSYMNFSESLVVKGGEDWEKWDAAMARNLNKIQNEDGSWTGHHCITGRTFCTSAALMVLMADRTPVPVEALTEETQEE